MTAEWIEVEHLPTRKLTVRFDGSNGADIAALMGHDPRLCRWDGYLLTVVNEQGEFQPQPGNWLIRETDGVGVYPISDGTKAAQYRHVGDDERTLQWAPT